MDIKDIEFQWNEEYPIFHSQKYLKTISDNYGWLGGFIDGELIFVLPYVVIKKYGLNLLRFVHNEFFTGVNNSLYNTQYKLFLNGIISYFKTKNIDLIIQPTTNTLFEDIPDNSVYAQYGDYKINLSIDIDQLWKNVHTKHRNSIRKGIKNNVLIKEGVEYADIAYDLIKLTFNRSGKSYMSKMQFFNLINSLDSNVKVFIAFHENTPQGCAVIPFSKHSAYYSHGGSINKPISGSLNYLQWHIIEYFKKHETKTYSLVGARVNPKKGSKSEGIQNFKKRFGATLDTGYLWKYSFNKPKSLLYNTAYKLLRDKDGDIIDKENKS
jgi:hypothetical protein